MKVVTTFFSHLSKQLFQPILLLIALLLFMRILHGISIYQEFDKISEHRFSWLLTEHTPTCFYNNSYFYWKIDSCVDLPIGSFLEVIGRVSPESDDSFTSKKRLMISSISMLSERAVSDDDWLRNFLRQQAILRDQVQSRLIDLLGESVGGIALSLVLGTQAYLDQSYRHNFEITGTLHILAVSGLHVSLLLGVVDRGMSAFSTGKLKATLLWMVVSGYVLLVGYKPSVLRAWGMLSLALCARYLFHRQYNSLQSLVVVAMVLVIIRPDWLFHPGWQLSVAATGSILVCAHRFSALIGKLTLLPEVNGFSSSSSSFSFFHLWKQSLSISLAAQFATFPLVLFHFGSAPMLGFIPGSVLTMVAGVLLYLLFPLVVGTLVLEVISPHMALIGANLIALLLESFVQLVSLWAQIDWWLVEIV